MPKTVLRARLNGVAFYLNTETSSPSTGRRNRYRLFKTTNCGRDKAGWVQIGSRDGQALLAIDNEPDLFAACNGLFESKRPHPYFRRETIRGRPGSWEGEAFPQRLPDHRDVTDQRDNQNLTRQASNHSVD